jgi:hypothetical protein
MPSSSGYLRTVPNQQMPVGGGTNRAFYQNDTTISVNYTVPSGQNAMTAGPVTIDSGITVTVSSGSYWTVV